MVVAYTADKRAALDAKAQAILEACPDVGSFIRRGLGRDPEAEAVVYLRTALDPAPVITTAREFEGALNAATRWLAAKASARATSSRCSRPTARRPPSPIGRQCPRRRSSR